MVDFQIAQYVIGVEVYGERRARSGVDASVRAAARRLSVPVPADLG